SEKFETFYFDQFFMADYGIEGGAIVAVIPVSELQPEMCVLASVGESFLMGNVKYDAGFYFILDKTGFPVPLDIKNNVVGEPVGYCPIERTGSNFIEFSRLVKK